MELSVLCGRRIDRYRSGCSGHVLPGWPVADRGPHARHCGNLPIGVLDDPHGAVIGRS